MNKYLMFVLFYTANASSFAVDDEWGDDWQEESPYEVLFDASYGYAHLLKSDAENIKDSILDEFRFEIQFNYTHENFKINSDTRLIFDRVVDENKLTLTELNIAFSPITNGDLKIGRQIITWGTGDLVFLNDLFPKDWISFFNGRDDSDLKFPSDAFRISKYGDLVNVDLVITPEFTADNTLKGERYSFYLPTIGVAQPQPEISTDKPDGNEIALRLFKNVEGNEWAIYLNKGYFKSPSKMENGKKPSYAKLDSIGASYRLPLFGGIANFETVYYRSLEDKQGTNAGINNSQSRYLIGYESEVASNLTIASQVYLERIHDYRNLAQQAGLIDEIPDRTRTLITSRLTMLAMQQTLINSVMVFFSPSDKDYYLRFNSQYKFSDQLRFFAGVNWLGGEQEHTFLAQLNENSNVFFRVHFSFE